MKKKFLTLITVVLALVMSLFAFVGCSGAPTKGFDVELMQAFCKANDIELELKTIKPSHAQSRKYSLAELLFCMLRSGNK